MIKIVEISKKTEKDLKKLPKNIIRLFDLWVDYVIEDGLEKTRMIPGYHDEALKGEWKGYRSVRLNRSYRVFYKIDGDVVKFAFVERINKHEYKK